MPRPPEERRTLHPFTEWQRRRYLLRHWRHREARQRLVRSLLRWARPGVWRWRERWDRRPRPPHLALPSLLSYLHPGDVLLDAGGAELCWLEQMLAGQARPAVVYRSDIRLTAHFDYHPVETVWLLELAGYRVQWLGAAGPGARPDDWYAAFASHIPGPWLLATPPSRQGATP